MGSATNACQERYNAFTEQYAVDSDRIRALWSALNEEMQTLGDLFAKMEEHKVGYETATQSSIAGLARMKTGCTQMEELGKAVRVTS